ncbi:hypothetical protein METBISCDRAFT_18302 [Metschnikowia bicuspidata]|uniref:ATPase, F0 complex, subunit J n=1 Tax=Metschnikowia bicuspidata TaxID=27322 RepID=A0A4P9ZAE9_9ASCO|nr:hypothetical protein METBISCDRAFT_18302 [Metschnikowia bicuspidata]
MSGVRFFPTPIVKPLWPFFAGFLILTPLVAKIQYAMTDADNFINDPRHPRFKEGGKFIDLLK